MRRLIALGLTALGLTFLGLALAVPARAETLTAPSGYRLVYDVYQPDGVIAPVRLIFMHGKNGTHRAPFLIDFAKRLAAGGIEVYLPLMPWSRNWNGTAADGLSALDALVAVAAQGPDGTPRKVAVGGQSMGATFTIGWRPTDAPPAVIAKVLTSPGGLLDLIPPSNAWWKTVEGPMRLARDMEAAGKGQETARFVSNNVVGTKQIQEIYETTPAVFLSFHDVARFPSSRQGLAKNVHAVFWGVGRKDPIDNAKRSTFNIMPPHPASRYVEYDGDHNSTMGLAANDIVAFLRERATAR